MENLELEKNIVWLNTPLKEVLNFNNMSEEELHVRVRIESGTDDAKRYATLVVEGQ